MTRKKFARMKYQKTMFLENIWTKTNKNVPVEALYSPKPDSPSSIVEVKCANG